MATTANTSLPGAGKRQFAERAPRFVKRNSRAPDSLALALAAYAALIVICALSGAFGTHALALGPRLVFWTALIVWNGMKWHAWFALVRPRLGWPLAIVIGAFLLNLSLPFETRIALGLPLGAAGADFVRIYPSAAAISLVGGAVCTIAARHFGAARREPASAPIPLSDTPPRGGIWALGFNDADLWAVEADDHYVRLLLASGRSVLHAARFGDVLAQVSHIDGCRIHRGRWVADAAVVAAERDGRAWRVVLPDARRMPISASYVGSVRERAWMTRAALRQA